MRVDVNLFGRLALGEVVMILLFPIALHYSYRKILRVQVFKRLFYYLILWSFGVFISDVLINDSHLNLLVKGLGRPLIVIVHLFGFYYILSKDNKSFIYFFFGLFVSGLINYFVPTDFRAEEIIENLEGSTDDFGYGYFAYVWTYLFYGIVSVGGYFLYKKSTFIAAIFQIIMGVISLPILSRTTGAVFILAGVLILSSKYFPYFKKLYIQNGVLVRGSITKTIFTGVLLFCIVFYGYAAAASTGVLGERQRLKYEAQSASYFGDTPWGFLMSGRHYTVGAIIRIIENPIFGSGSWPVQNDTMLKASRLLGQTPSKEAWDPNKRELGHSVVFGMWAQAGILTLPFFYLSILLSIKFLVQIVFVNHEIKALILPYTLLFIFSVFFNNFNSLLRIELVLFPLVYYLLLATSLRKDHKSK